MAEEYAIVIMPGDRPAQVWPTSGRSKESFEAHCAICGVTVIRGYGSLQEALEALYLPIDDGFRQLHKSR